MRLFYYISLIFIFVSYGYAQPQLYTLSNIKFKNYSTRDGLSQRSVTRIIQDNYGFMWLGTRYGLNKFDGYDFKEYYFNSDDPKSLSNSWITDLSKDTNGTLWIATKNGLNKYNEEFDAFDRIYEDSNKQKSYSKEIWDIEVQDSTFIWIATSDGLDKFNIKTNQFLSFRYDEHIAKSLSSNQIRHVLALSSGKIWVCTTASIDFYDAETNSFRHFSYPNNASPNLTKNNTVDLFQDSEGTVWLGYSDGLAYFNANTNRFENFEIFNERAIISPTRIINEDRQGNLWIGTYNGLYVIDKKRNKISLSQHDINNPQSLTQNSVYEVYQDTRGDLWIGTWAGGISYHDKSSNDFTTYREGITNRNLNYKVVSSFVEDGDDLWIGSEGGGINILDRNSGTFTYFEADPRNSYGLSANNIKAIEKDKDGNFWIGTHAGGLNHVKIVNDKKIIRSYKNDPNNSNSISDNKVTTLFADDNSNIWIGTNEGGISYFSKNDQTFNRLENNEGIIGKSIYTIESSLNRNAIFVGSNNGLAKIELINFKITSINFDNRKLDNTLSKLVTSVFAESENSIWIGTEGQGLFNYNLQTGQSTRFGVKEGMPNEVIYSILPDNNNNIWISTNKGLTRIDLEIKQIKNFDQSDGLQADEFNYGASYKTKDGKLLFGGIDGFTIFDPGKVTSDAFVPPVSITSFNLRNKPYAIITPNTKSIKLNHNQNDFSFDFVALNYSQPNKNQYAYKLEGFDKDWNFIENNKTAVYTNINPGNYNFIVKASNGDGVWNDIGQNLELKISPPLWKTWWAYLLYFVVATFTIALIRKYELKRIQNRNELKKERLDKEQMEEVNRLKLQLFTNISHDFRTPLTLIVGPLKKMINENVGGEKIQTQLVGMYRNATILLQLINQLLDFRKSEAGKLRLHASENDLIQFLNKALLSFGELANDRNIQLTLNSTGELGSVWFDKIEMRKVILNILSNAFKFTPVGGEISIAVSPYVLPVDNVSRNYVKIEIKDSGKGIPKEDLNYVFDRYFQLGQQNELRSGTGVGLALAKDIVDLHQGKIYVESEVGMGSSFTVLLPMGNEHLSPDQILTYDPDIEETLDYKESAVLKSISIESDRIENDFQNVDEDKFTILIVEDNPEVRSFITSLFDGDYNIFAAENGARGIELAEDNPIDIIISDVMMPEMDGMQMTNNLKSNIKTSHIPIILLTARTSTKVQTQGYEMGADAYITKPFDGETLKLQVENILRSRQQLIDKFKKDILLEPNEIATVSQDEIFLKKAMEIIEENISDPEFNVNSFIEMMFMSQSVIYRKIKFLTGQSISEFIRSVRLKKAGQLLVKTDISIANISYDIGFNDLKYFRKCFKAVFNVTPSEYRKNHLESHSKSTE